MKKKTRKILGTLLACTMLGTTMAGATLAYLTDNETATNTVTVGNVDIGLTEPGWPGNDHDDVKLVDPTGEVTKDPQITNTGNGNAIVFISVEVPKQTVTLMNLDGTVKTAGSSTERLQAHLSHH